MGGPWRERSIDRVSRAPTAPKPSVARAPSVEPDAVSAAVVGFVVALVTSLSVSLACIAYLR
jgi:hypothetical protein